MSDDALLAALVGSDHALPVAILDAAGRVESANRAAHELLGPRGAPGASIADAFDPACRAKIDRALASPRHARCELQLRTAAGALELVELLVVPQGARRIAIVTAVGVRYGEEASATLVELQAELANVTRELSRRASDLGAARDRLERLGALRDEFIATLSHDVRAPLGAIRLHAETIERGAATLGPDQVARCAAAIERTVDRLVALTSRVLDAARLEAGAVALRLEPCDLAEVARDAVDSLGSVAANAGVRLEWIAPAAAPVNGDRVRLLQIVSNLVENAIRHGPHGSVVRISIETRESVVRCTVTDAGSGVAPELREAIFERFRSGRGAAGAAGLGLFIARQLATGHGGRLWVEEARPRGAAFVLELPRG